MEQEEKQEKQEKKENQTRQDGRWRVPFFTMTIGQTVSLIGTSAVQFSLIWWLSVGTGSAYMLALAGLVAFLPQILLGTFAGVWIDRWNKKYVTIAADLFMGTVALVYAVIFAVKVPPYWTVCAVLGIRAVGNVFQAPAVQSILPLLVPSEELVRANGWSQLIQSGAFILGPALGAAMYAVLPMPLILFTDFAGAVVASVSLAVIRVPRVRSQAGKLPNFKQELLEGFRLFSRDRRLLVLVTSVFLCMLFVMPLSSYYPLMSSSYFKTSAWLGGLIEVMYASGMLVSSAVFAGLGKVKDKLRTAYFGLVVMGASSFVGGLLPATPWGFAVFAASILFMGASANIYGIPYMAYLQETIPLEAQGRVFSLIGTLNSISMPLGLLISSPVAEKAGVPFWFLLSGIGILLVVAAAYRLIRR